MTLCRFFMQGNCRYGNNCWNEHPTGGNQGFSVTAQRQLFGGGNKTGSSNNRGQGQQSQVTFGQNRFKWISPDTQQQQQQQQNRGGTAAVQQLSTADIVSALAVEVQTMFENGKMWPFTCIGFEKDLPSLPGFSDLSMEEVRLEAYEAQKSGTFQPFEQKFLALVNDVMTKRQELKTPNMTLKQKLFLFIDDARKKKDSGSVGQTSLFSGPTDKGLFGEGSSGGLFGSSQTSGQSGSGLFASKEQTGTFGQSGQSSLFGQTPAFGQSASTFGQPPSVGQSVNFGQTGQTGQMFGQTTGQTGFGQTSTIFGQQTSQPVSTFGQPQTPKANLFGKSDSPLKSASFQTPSSATGTSQTFFGSPTPAQTSSQSPVPVSNLFGAAVVPSGTAFGTSTAQVPKQAVQAEPEDSAYTALESLTVEDLDQFRSATFTVGQIPTKPPPRELCF